MATNTWNSNIVTWNGQFYSGFEVTHHKTTATKKKVDELKGKSDKYITTKNNEYKKVVSIDADKIDQMNKSKEQLKQSIEKADDLLSKANGYTSQKAAYDAQAKKIADDQAKLKKLSKKSKDSKQRKSLEADIKSATKNKKAIAQNINKITSDPKFKATMDGRRTAARCISTIDLAIKAKQALKAKDKKSYEKYHKELIKRKEKQKKALQKKNGKKINATIAAAKKKYQGRTALYRTDKKTSRVFMLAEMSPSETVSIDVPTNPVDNSDPRTNYTVEDTKELSGTYYIYGTSFEDCDKKYAILQGWGRKGIELTISGFSKLKHCKIQSVGKARDAPYKNVLEIPLTLSYILPSKIDYAKTKKKTKSKAKTSKKKGTSKSAKRFTVVKKGETLLEIARKTDVPYSTLKKLNQKVGDTSLHSNEIVRTS